MEDNIIFGQTQEETFSKRVWKLFKPYFGLYSILLILPLFHLKGDKGINILIYVIVLSVLAMTYAKCYKWAKTKVSRVTLTADTFQIEIESKNNRQTYQIPVKNIRTRLKWQGGRPRLLVLSIANGDTKIADFYSGGRRKNEFELETISMEINKTIAPTPNPGLKK